MNKYKSRVISLGMGFLFLIAAITARSQQKDWEPLKHVFQDLLQQYQKEQQLSFAINYIYTGENDPKKILDSETAKIEMSGKKYYCHVDSTEIFSNDTISIVLFKEEKIMYLTRSKSSSNIYNPVGMLDSMLSSKMISDYYITMYGNKKNVLVKFPPGMGYKQIDFSIDTTTGYLSNIAYHIKTEQLMEQGATKDDLENYEEYAVVKADFSQYSTNQTNMLGFTPTVFFTKSNKELKVTDKYKDYKIYLGSLGL